MSKWDKKFEKALDDLESGKINEKETRRLDEKELDEKFERGLDSAERSSETLDAQWQRGLDKIEQPESFLESRTVEDDTIRLGKTSHDIESLADEIHSVENIETSAEKELEDVKHEIDRSIGNSESRLDDAHQEHDVDAIRPEESAGPIEDNQLETENHQTKKESTEAPDDSSLKKMEQSDVDDILSKLDEDMTPESMSAALEELYMKHASKETDVYYADISKHKAFEDALHKHREEVEGGLKERLDYKQSEYDMRLGVADGRAYLRESDPNPTRLENAYGNLYHYFRDRSSFDEYVADVGKSIGIEDQDEVLKHIRKLAPQMISEPASDSCINPKLGRIRGDHLDLMNDLSGKSLSNLEGEISKLTKQSGKGGIENPLYPQGEKLEVGQARLAATALTDCHLKPNGTLEYYESEKSRIRQFEKDLQVFGDIKLNPKLRKGENLYVSYLPTPLGKMLEHLGIPPGDRTVQNPGIFPEFKEFSPKAQLAFIEDLVPQDGTITGKTIRWTHSNALHPAAKTETYGIKPKVGVTEIDLIKEHGNREQHSWALRYKKLKELRESDSEEIKHVAKELWKAVLENPNNLIKDEVEAVRGLGVKMDAKPYTIRYHERTGRVSIEWAAEPRSVFESIKLAMLAPANDEIKRGIMKDLINNHPEYVRRARKHFAKRGIEVREWWK